MKLKKFRQFINENLTPEELDEPVLDTTYDSVDDFKKELGDEELPEDEYDFSDEEDDNVDLSDEESDELPEEELGEEGEEEGHEYKGTLLMNELADKLGVEVVDNQINYNGTVINYYSETEKFHIGKQKFETVEDVLNHLDISNEQKGESLPAESVEAPTENVLEESRRYIKKF